MPGQSDKVPTSNVPPPTRVYKGIAGKIYKGPGSRREKMLDSLTAVEKAEREESMRESMRKSMEHIKWTESEEGKKVLAERRYNEEPETNLSLTVEIAPSAVRVAECKVCFTPIFTGSYRINSQVPDMYWMEDIRRGNYHIACYEGLFNLMKRLRHIRSSPDRLDDAATLAVTAWVKDALSSMEVLTAHSSSDDKTVIKRDHEGKEDEPRVAEKVKVEDMSDVALDRIMPAPAAGKKRPAEQFEGDSFDHSAKSKKIKVEEISDLASTNLFEIVGFTEKQDAQASADDSVHETEMKAEKPTEDDLGAVFVVSSVSVPSARHHSSTLHSIHGPPLELFSSHADLHLDSSSETSEPEPVAPLAFPAKLSEVLEALEPLPRKFTRVNVMMMSRMW